ncbi:MAG: AAA family ATPase [Chloroflexales bacterium]|nr:AAA family ATPase [Chloroflexales bacterium]
MDTEFDQIAGNGQAFAQAELPPLPVLPAGPYNSSAEHLRDELCRIDQLVRAQTVRWWMTIAVDKPEHLWGMVHVTDAEVARYIQSPFWLPPDLPSDLENALAGYWQTATDLAQAIEQRLEQTPPALRSSLRLARLSEIFTLSVLQRDLLLVCLLPEIDARYRRLFGYLQDDASRSQPTVELALQILDPIIASREDAWNALYAGSALVDQHLLLLGDARGDEALPAQSVRLDGRIAGYLLDSDTIDERLRDLAIWPSELAWSELSSAAEHLERLQALAAWWREQRQDDRFGAALLLHGPYGSGRLAAARAICTQATTTLLVIDAERALRAPSGWERIVDLAYREARLQNAALFWAGCEPMLDREQSRHPWDYLVAAAEQFNGLTFLASHTTWDPIGRFRTPTRTFLRLAFPMPDYQVRRALWEKRLPPAAALSEPPSDPDLLAAMLANSFQLTEGQIVDAVANAYSQAQMRHPQQPRLTPDDLYEGCRRQTGQRLINMARLIEPRTDLTFDDLILPKPNKRQLDELRRRIRYRSQLYSGLGFERRLSLGKGLITLFTGSSGTGKTMAAELLAREQGVDLYKIDLSAVVSKYVGETEKNLNRVFAEAEDANAILFFDEADALFGKRGEVKEARDKWANMETNFLLQRVEEYTGVVILASNLRQNFDEAFMRRIHVIVEFPFPEPEARLRIWQGMFPPGIQRPADDDLATLAAQFRLAGGSIKNIVVDAAFRALAEADGAAPNVTMRHLIAGTVREYQKLGKPITKGEFSPTFYAWVEQDALLG